MKKKGFTLVELLAVIAILAILVIIALPNVLGMFQSAKKNTFATELQNIYKAASTQFVSDSMRAAGQQSRGLSYARVGGTNCPNYNELDLSGTTTIDYIIQFSLSGRVEKFVATDGAYQFVYEDGDLKIEQIDTSKFDSATKVTYDYTVKTIADELDNYTKAKKNGTAYDFSQVSFRTDYVKKSNSSDSDEDTTEGETTEADEPVACGTYVFTNYKTEATKTGE